MSQAITCILVASAGALCQEVLHWYNLRNKLLDTEVKNLIRSKGYWIITIAMIVFSGFGTYYLFCEDIPQKTSVLFVLGAAFPSLFKKLVEAKSNEGHHLGESTFQFSEVVKLYFH